MRFSNWSIAPSKVPFSSEVRLSHWFVVTFSKLLRVSFNSFSISSASPVNLDHISPISSLVSLHHPLDSVALSSSFIGWDLIKSDSEGSLAAICPKSGVTCSGFG